MTAIYIALTVILHYEPKMRKIIFHQYLQTFCIEKDSHMEAI